MQVKALLGLPLDHARFPYVYLDATYLHGWLGRNLRFVSGLTHSCRLLRNSRVRAHRYSAADLRCPPGLNGSDQADVPGLSPVPKAGQDMVAAAMSM